MAGTRRPPARRVAELVAGIGRPLYRRQGFGEPRVLTEWAAIVGAELARQSCPERLSASGVLRVRTSGPAALELKHLEPLILERLATYFGFRAVQRLTLVQGPLPRPKGPGRRRGPLSPEAALAVTERAAPVKNSELRQALERLGQAVLAPEAKPSKD